MLPYVDVPHDLEPGAVAHDVQECVGVAVSVLSEQRVQHHVEVELVASWHSHRADVLCPNHVAASVAPEIPHSRDELLLGARPPEASCQRHVGRVAEIHVQVADIAPETGVICKPASASLLLLLRRQYGFEVSRSFSSDLCRILRYLM